MIHNRLKELREKQFHTVKFLRANFVSILSNQGRSVVEAERQDEEYENKLFDFEEIPSKYQRGRW
jgi:predicted house-cleaning noncanonical NTP pyrophosphatase (MazG superfamily)